MIPALIAPLLQQGLGLLANAALAKGKDFIEEKTGVKLDQPLSQEDITKLRQFELEHEEELQRIRLEDKKLDLEETKAYLADTQSARAREMSIATSAHAGELNRNIVPILAIGVLALTFLLFAVVLFDDGSVEASRKDLVIYVLGVLSAISTQVVAYYFGSSKGSADKTEQMVSRLEGKQ